MSRPGLYLITPVIDDTAAFGPLLEAACETGLVEAVLLRLTPADERSLVKLVKTLAPTAQQHEAAVIIADPGADIDLVNLVMRSGADGGHAEVPARIAALIDGLKDGRSTGAGGLRSKHDAMTVGEMGVDYVLFGEPRPDGFIPEIDLVEERAAWWAEIFQTPCAAFAPSLEEISRLTATGAEFVALGDAVWSHEGGPAEALARIGQSLALAQPGAPT